MVTTSPKNYKLTVKYRFVKLLLKYLGELSPCAVKFSEIIDFLNQYIKDSEGKSLTAKDINLMREFIMQCYINNAILFNAVEIKLVNKVSHYPIASPLARFQARSGLKVTSENHETKPFDLVIQKIFSLIDGKNDLKAVGDKLLQMTETGELVFKKKNGEIMDRDAIKNIIEEKLEPNIQNLAKTAYLIG